MRAHSPEPIAQSYKSKFKILVSILLICLIHSQADAASLSHMEKLFLQERYERVIIEADSLIDARSGQQDEIYYLKGLGQLKLNQFRDARETFEAIISKFPRSRRIFDAHIGIGDSYFLKGDINTADMIYNEILKKNPNNNKELVSKRIESCKKRVGNIYHTSNVEPKDEGNKAERYISVQVGCFKNGRNAQRLADKLSGQGYESYVESSANSGDNLYHVKIGKLQSKKEAESLEAKLKKQGYPTRICLDNGCQ